jgi:hypothetical protein
VFIGCHRVVGAPKTTWSNSIGYSAVTPWLMVIEVVVMMPPCVGLAEGSM